MISASRPLSAINGVAKRGVELDRADTLERLSEIDAAVFTVFGSFDPHVPPEALQQVLAAFEASGLNHRSTLLRPITRSCVMTAPLGSPSR